MQEIITQSSPAITLKGGISLLGSCHRKIRQRIEAMPQGEVFAIPDFEDIASAKTISKTLTRLSDESIIRRVTRGVFWKPNGNGELPHPDKIAHALARSNTWRVAPSGDTALHLFGLRKDRPGVWTYITDGTCRDYEVGGTKIIFQHASGKALGTMSEKAAMLVQVFKAYGKFRLSDDTLRKIRKKLNPSEFQPLLEETKNSPAWISTAIQNMLRRKKSTGICHRSRLLKKRETV